MKENHTLEVTNSIVTWVARLLIIAAIIAFFIPFCTVSCSGHTIGEVSMKDMMAGKEISESSYGEHYEEDGSVVYLLCLILPVTALGISFFKKRIVSGIVNLIDGISILVLCGTAIKTVEKVCNMFNCTTKKAFGYVLYQLYGWLMIILGVIGIILFILSRKRKDFDELSVQQQAIDSNEMLNKENITYKYCPNCGNRNESENTFCRNCGNKLSE